MKNKEEEISKLREDLIVREKNFRTLTDKKDKETQEIKLKVEGEFKSRTLKFASERENWLLSIKIKEEEAKSLKKNFQLKFLN